MWCIPSTDPARQLSARLKIGQRQRTRHMGATISMGIRMKHNVTTPANPGLVISAMDSADHSIRGWSATVNRSHFEKSILSAEGHNQGEGWKFKIPFQDEWQMMISASSSSCCWVFSSSVSATPQNQIHGPIHLHSNPTGYPVKVLYATSIALGSKFPRNAERLQLLQVLYVFIYQYDNINV